MPGEIWYKTDSDGVSLSEAERTKQETLHHVFHQTGADHSNSDWNDWMCIRLSVCHEVQFSGDAVTFGNNGKLVIDLFMVYHLCSRRWLIHYTIGKLHHVTCTQYHINFSFESKCRFH
ncbi:hypothetical protein AVEN_246585-1 [Araneus ventricosus]|uniref:Uncharacterized protein n=1 Tax=Araneus ventricosus TaxID=182803 RepID=A0A4Y2DCM4_ARAVE|nr:hypothetical protein AVEN_246585-1 [Araneus ventricosus]